MDSHVWRTVYQAIRAADKGVPREGRQKTFSDVQVVAMYLWSVFHDRTLSWACHRSSYGSAFPPRKLPSISQFCKRIKSTRCNTILQKVHEALGETATMTNLSFLDGRALEVGAYTKDRDAKRGPVPGGMGRGYRLHAWATRDQRIPIWSVMPLNVSEKTVAGELLDHQVASGVIMADGNYDAGWLYDRVAEAGGNLLTPLPENAGGGHRRQSPSRMAAAKAWEGMAGYSYRERLGVERTFGHTACFAGGLSHLPPWVRGLERVRRWVGAKLIVYHARWQCRKKSA